MPAVTLGRARARAIARAARNMTTPPSPMVERALAAAFDAGREHAARIADEFVELAADHNKKDQGQRRMARRIAQMIREEAE